MPHDVNPQAWKHHPACATWVAPGSCSCSPASDHHPRRALALDLALGVLAGVALIAAGAAIARVLLSTGVVSP